MRTARHIAVLLSTTALAATTLTALTTTSAAAATCSATRPTTVPGARFTYGVCQNDGVLAVKGKLVDTREDGCLARVDIRFAKPGEDRIVSYETGSEKAVEVGDHEATSVKVGVMIRC